MGIDFFIKLPPPPQQPLAIKTICYSILSIYRFYMEYISFIV